MHLVGGSPRPSLGPRLARVPFCPPAPRRHGPLRPMRTLRSVASRGMWATAWRLETSSPGSSMAPLPGPLRWHLRPLARSPCSWLERTTRVPGGLVQPLAVLLPDRPAALLGPTGVVGLRALARGRGCGALGLRAPGGLLAFCPGAVLERVHLWCRPSLLGPTSGLPPWGSRNPAFFQSGGGA